ncbi:hypothetical protein F4703DRAFT_1937631 [Phycomyces blakesleeanus]
MVAPADFESVVTMVLVTGQNPGQKIIDNYGFSRRFRKRCDNGVGSGKKENDAVVAPVDFESVVALIGTRSSAWTLLGVDQTVLRLLGADQTVLETIGCGPDGFDTTVCLTVSFSIGHA